ncbi:MAG: bifunctional enoyl-CoA hydratase/phosphate acetyltransferase [Burkholderiales bacterium]|nr:bifunctional enoyl-CoA hydratase/phosphate acetyltransferase [Burkholderiales bacterium]
MDYIENRTFDEIAMGDGAKLTRTLQLEDIQLFAVMSGDVNPSHLDPEYAQNGRFHGLVAHGMWGAALISCVLGTHFPGPGTVYVGQSLQFIRPVHLGDTLTVEVVVTAKHSDNGHLVLHCRCMNQDGLTAIEGDAEVIAPRDKVRRPRVALPEVQLIDHERYYQQLRKAVNGLAPLRVAVVHAVDAESIRGAADAAAAGLIEPVWIGPAARMRTAAEAAGVYLAPHAVVDVPHSHAAAAEATRLAARGDVDAIMKGSLHTDELMAAVLAHDAGLRTARRVSHVFVMDVPRYPRPLLITDAAINIAPDLEQKRDIVQNAIDLAHSLGIAQPKVAILSAVETVSAKLQSTLDAAALCKMADRGQIIGGLLDGPLAFDNAISAQAAATKGIQSDIAGQSDILVVPDLESGNMLAKQLQYLAGAQAAGIVLGARVPIILTSRADLAQARMASCAVALLYVRSQQMGASV